MNYFDAIREHMRDLEVYVSNNIRRENPSGFEQLQRRMDVIRVKVSNDWLLRDRICLDLSVGTIRGNFGAAVCSSYFRDLDILISEVSTYAIAIDPTSRPLAEALQSVGDAMTNRVTTAKDVFDPLTNPQIPLWLKAVAALFVLNTFANLRR